jgi:hypothetical protein
MIICCSTVCLYYIDFCFGSLRQVDATLVPLQLHGLPKLGVLYFVVPERKANFTLEVRSFLGAERDDLLREVEQHQCRPAPDEREDLLVLGREQDKVAVDLRLSAGGR